MGMENCLSKLTDEVNKTVMQRKETYYLQSNRSEHEFLLSSERLEGTLIGVNAGKISAEILMAIDAGEMDYRATQFAIVHCAKEIGVEVNGDEFDWIMQDVREQTKIEHPEWFV